MEEFTIGHKMAAAAAAAAALIRFLLCPLCVALICVSLSLSLWPQIRQNKMKLFQKTPKM